MMLLPLALALGLATQYAPQQLSSDPLAPPLEARVQVLGKQLRCAVCQGLSVADSPASMARAQLDKVRELVAGGKTDEEVREYFVARYGEWVLLEPSKSGFNWLVWLGPVVLLAGGLALIARQVRRAPPGVPAPAPSPAAPGADAPPVDPYLAAVRSELER